MAQNVILQSAMVALQLYLNDLNMSKDSNTHSSGGPRNCLLGKERPQQVSH